MFFLVVSLGLVPCMVISRGEVIELFSEAFFVVVVVVCLLVFKLAPNLTSAG